MHHDLAGSDDVRVTRDGAISRITLTRPERDNRLDWSMIVALLETVRAVSADPQCRLLVLDADGENFCAGDCWPDMGPWPQAWKHRLPGGTHGAPPLPLTDLLATLRGLPIPTLAVLRGEIADAGLDLACHCDIRLAADTARFCDRRVANGRFAATGITYVLPRLIGQSLATRLLLLGDTFDAVYAARTGLVYDTTPAADLAVAATALADRLSNMATRSYGLVKQQVQDQLDLDYRNALLHSMAIRQTNVFEDRAEGQRAFAEKRAPHFSGR